MLADTRGRVWAWLLTRTLAAVVVVLMMFNYRWKHVFDDLDVYSRWGLMLAAGNAPSSDPAWQYPPGAAFVFAAIGKLGSDPWMFALFFIAIDVAISAAFAREGRRTGNWHGLAFWMLAPLMLGPVLYGRYDGVPTLTAVIGLLALSAGTVRGAWLGIGGGLKIWPAMLCIALERRGWIRSSAGAASALAVTIIAAAVAFPTVLSSFIRNSGARGLQIESVAALPFVWARLLGVHTPVQHRFGASEFATAAADQISGWLLPLTALGLVALVVVRASGRLDRSPAADIALVTVLWLMITSRVLSPQYNVWLVGIAAVVWAAGSQAMRRTTILVAVTALAAQILYPFAYAGILHGGPVGVTIQTVRILALLAAFVMGLRVLYLQAASAQETPAPAH
jgi:hypothetical protein